MFPHDAATSTNEVHHHLGTLRGLVTRLNPAAVPLPDAPGLWQAFATIARLAAAAQTLLAPRVENTGAWKRAGYRSAAEYLARQAGSSVRAARVALATARRLEDLPATTAALRRGSLSIAQCERIADAATVAPEREAELLATASRVSLAELPEACGRIKAAADPDPDANNERIHRNRLRQHTDNEGAWHLHGYGTSEAGSLLNTALGPLIDELYDQARETGEHHHRDTYVFDALVELLSRAIDGHYDPDDDDDLDEDDEGWDEEGWDTESAEAHDSAEHTDWSTDAGGTGDGSSDATSESDRQASGPATDHVGAHPAYDTRTDDTPPTGHHTDTGHAHPTSSAEATRSDNAVGCRAHPIGHDVDTGETDRTDGAEPAGDDPPLGGPGPESDWGSDPRPAADGRTGVGGEPPTGHRTKHAGPVTTGMAPDDQQANTPKSPKSRQRKPKETTKHKATKATNGRKKRRRRSRDNPRYMGLLRIDYTALVRGHIEGDEVCEISGVGPVPVKTAHRLLDQATVKLVITKGTDVVNVTHLGRQPTVAQHVALLWQNPGCSAEGCPHSYVQTDHRDPWTNTRHTVLGELDHLFPHDHRLKTYHGWSLVEGTGTRPFVPPTDPATPTTSTPPARTAPTPARRRHDHGTHARRDVLAVLRGRADRPARGHRTVRDQPRAPSPTARLPRSTASDPAA